MEFSAVCFDEGKRRLDEGGGEPVARDQRPIAAAPRRQGLADDGGGERGGTLARLGVERRKEKRPSQTLVERPAASEDFADRLLPPRAKEREQRQIVERARAGHATRADEYPPRKPAAVRAEGPPLAGREVEEGKGRLFRPDQSVAGADRLEIGKHRPVAGEDEMIAVVDDEIERRIVIGAAAPAGLARRLIERDASARCGEPHGGGEAGETGTDDVSGAGHQTSA